MNAWKKTKRLVIALAIGAIPLVTIGTCSLTERGFDVVLDDGYYDDYRVDVYIEDDYYYDDYYYNDCCYLDFWGDLIFWD